MDLPSPSPTPPAHAPGNGRPGAVSLVVAPWFDEAGADAAASPGQGAAASPLDERLAELLARLERVADVALAALDQAAPLDRLIDKAEAARLYGTSPRTIERWNDTAKIPAPVLTAGGLRWNLRDITSHIRAGLPGREEWERMRREQERLEWERDHARRRR